MLSGGSVMVLNDPGDAPPQELSSRVQRREWKTTRLQSLLSPVMLLILAAASVLMCICSR